MDGPVAKKATNPSRKRKPSSQQGKDELNLATIPLSVLTHQQPTDTERKQKHYSRSFAYTVYDDQANQWVPAKVTLRSNPDVGLPTPADESLFLALFNIALDARAEAGDRVKIVPNQLFKMMGLKSSNDRAYSRLSKQLDRLTAVNVICEYAWYDIDNRKLETKHTFGVLSEAKLTKKTSRGKIVDRYSYVVLDQHLYTSLTSGTLKPIDLTFYFSLKLPTSRRMYRTLDRYFYNRKDFSTDLRNFAHGNLGMSDDYKSVGKLKSKLNPAINELVLANFIQPADPSDRYTKVKKGIWRVHFEKVPKAKRQAAAKKTTKPTPVSAIAQQLIDRGIKQPVAVKLAKDHPASVINNQIEVFDWYNAKSQATQHKQPGWLIKAIADNYDHSKLTGFKSREQREATRKLSDEKRRREQAAEAERVANEKAQARRTAELEKLWQQQSDDRRQEILDHVLGENKTLRGLHAKGKGTSLIHEQCLSELDRREQGKAA